MSADSKLYADVLSTFFAEAKDMLQQMEDALLSLEDDPDDKETINALFRAIHTIKGSAGLFELNDVVQFTHKVESVLDRLRNGALHFDAKLSDILLKSADHVAVMLEHLESKSTDESKLALLGVESKALVEQLAEYLEHDTPIKAKEKNDPAQGLKPKIGTWHISLRFSQDAFRNGLDPISTLHYLLNLGEITTIFAIDDRLPDLELLDPESCFLGFEIRLFTAAPQHDIEAAFEFVQDDCSLRLFPPSGPEIDFVSLINELPEEPRLGDILVECGAVSRRIVEEAMQEHNNSQQLANAPRLTIGEILVAKNTVTPEIIDAALSKQSKMRETRTTDNSSRFVRVPADKLDALINLVGEMVICSASAGLLAQIAQNSSMLEATQQMSRLVEEIRNDALSLRMVYIGETFGRFKRVVRDVSSELGKKVELEIIGAETELDKSVVEKIADPLMHLVRNSLDHGIESPDMRSSMGKLPTAKICLSAHHDSGHVVIRVIDDGRGIDGEKLVAKARERGLISMNQQFTEQEKLNLIFLPGFSTAEVVTNLSGRGVGMDVVKKNIEALRGQVVLKSTVGVGTTIEIQLPLTLAIIDGFLVKVGMYTYVIPLQAVVECVDADNSKLLKHNRWSGNFDLRGDVLPFLELQEIFAIANDIPERRSIVVVKNNDSLIGLLVDQLQGEYQTVIKPLGKLFKNLRGVCGSTVLGSGEVALILDVPALVKVATEKEHEHNATVVDRQALIHTNQ